MYDVEGHLLCLEHYAMLTARQSDNLRNILAFRNQLVGDMEATGGLPRGSLGYQEPPRPVVHTGPMTHNNIRIDRSVIGAVNTGNIERLDVALNDIHNQGAPQVARALARLAEAVLASKRVSKDAKPEIIDQISFLAAEAATPPEQRRRSVARTVMGALRDTLGVTADFATVWAALHPLLAPLFH
jgi:hypothetical protein